MSTEINKPTPEQIKKTRIDAGITQKQASELVHYNIRSWRKVENGESKIHLSTWELFLIKIEAYEAVE